MKEIKNRFLTEQEKAPRLGDYIIFLRAIKGRSLDRGLLLRAFNKLVSQDDYAKSEKMELFNWIVSAR